MQPNDRVRIVSGPYHGAFGRLVEIRNGDQFTCPVVVMLDGHHSVDLYTHGEVELAATAVTVSDENPKKAQGETKPQLHLVPPALVIGAAKAYAEGAAKYGAFNWRETNVSASTYISTIQRHLAAFQDGEDVDPESATGKLHLDGIAASVGILLDAAHGGFLIDDRPPKGPAPELLRSKAKQ